MKANQVNKFNDPQLQTEFENIYNILQNLGVTDEVFTDSQRAQNFGEYVVPATANSSAGEDTSITHDLKRVPNFFDIKSQSGSGDFFDGTGTNTETSFFIRCTTASTRFRIGVS